MKLFVRILKNKVFVLVLSFSSGAIYADSGQELYEMNCSACHGVDGVAVLPGAPSFSKGETMEKDDVQLLASISNGLKTMPPWNGILNDEEKKRSLEYIRSLSK